MDQGEAEVEAVGDGGGSVRGNRDGLAALHLLQTPDIRSLKLKKNARGSRLPYRFAPPASGLTTTQSVTSKLLRIHLKVLGSAYKLSTGTLKKP